MFRQVNKHPEDLKSDEDIGTTLVVEPSEPKTKNPTLYRVIIFNDDFFFVVLNDRVW